MGAVVSLSQPHPTVRYDAMCRAIAAAYAVDEVKDLRDKALAIEVYAKQAKNIEAERQAVEIRLRAERRCGQLLRDREKQHGARGNPGGQGAKIVGSDHPTPQIGDLGVSKQQSSDWQKLAAVSEADFERAVKADKPTTSGIIAASAPPKPAKQASPKALWLWGRLMDFKRDGLLDTDPEELVSGMEVGMRKHVADMLPGVIEWLGRVADEA